MTQMLWINLVMDTLAAIAFAGEAALSRYMKEPPIPKNAPLITPDMWSAIFTNGIAMAIMSLFFLTSDGLVVSLPVMKAAVDYQQIQATIQMLYF